MTKSGVAVEKLPSAKLTKIKLRYDAPQSKFDVCLDIFYPPNSDRLEQKWSFSTATPVTAGPYVPAKSHENRSEFNHNSELVGSGEIE